MGIELNSLSDEELLALNRQIVSLLNRRREQNTSKALEKFTVGDLVYFDDDCGDLVEGVVTRVNRKTVTIHTDNKGQWRVSPAFVSKKKESECSNLVRIH